LKASALFAWFFGLCACRTPMSAEDYMQNELALVRPGVDIEAEEREVRRVLGQRGLDVVSELRGAGFVALGADSVNGRASALRIITGRGVVLAEDAARDDLFAPAHVALLDDFAPSVGDHVLIASERMAERADRGCVSLTRVLPDGAVVSAELDVSALGSRACVASVAHGEHGRLRATVAWPSLTLIETPEIAAELAFSATPLGSDPPRVPVIKVASVGPWLEQERARLSRLDVRAAPCSERHAIGVARAAVALLGGQDTAQQLAAYRMAIGLVPPGSLESDMVLETSDHIEHGWLDPVTAGEGDPNGADVPDDAEVIEPGAPPPEEAE
jgi:hypothetical protein